MGNEIAKPWWFVSANGWTQLTGHVYIYIYICVHIYIYTGHVYLYIYIYVPMPFSCPFHDPYRIWIPDDTGFSATSWDTTWKPFLPHKFMESCLFRKFTFEHTRKSVELLFKKIFRKSKPNPSNTKKHSQRSFPAWTCLLHRCNASRR